MTHQRSRWTIRAIDGRHAGGVFHEGVSLRELPLLPGVEIGVGNVTLIAESERSRSLTRFLARIIGLGANQRAQVDRALRTVLTAASGRRALTLCGGGGTLVSLARRLHEHVLGGKPFIVCDPQRVPGEANVRAARNVRDPLAALAAAAGGTLCVPIRNRPQGFERMVERWRGSEARVQLVLCEPTRDEVLDVEADAIELRPLVLHPRDRSRIIDEVAAEAAAELGVKVSIVSAADRRILLQSDAATLPALEKAMRRVFAIRHCDNQLTRAAQQLGMDRYSLDKWARRRGFIAT